MASTFFGLTISYSGLQAASTSLNVTGHNVSNINTKGYSKQQASTEAAQALRTFSTYGMLGAGVKVTGVSQLRDSYYDEKYSNRSDSIHQRNLQSDPYNFLLLHIHRNSPDCYNILMKAK